MIRIRVIPLTVAINLLGAVSSVLLGLLIAPPSAVAPYAGSLRLLLLAAFVLALALWLPVDLFLGSSLVILAISSGVAPISVGSIQLYTYDMLLALVLLRAALPRVRRANDLRFVDWSIVAPASLWAVVMVAAGIRGALSGNSVGAIARLEIPLVYFPAFCWGFTRILREVSISFPRVIRAIAISSLGVIGYAAFARITHQRFHSSGIGPVPTTEGNLRRDYGFYSSFEIYPLVALAGLAYLVFAGRRRFGASLVAGAGFAATFLTLVRGLIFGVLAGVISIIALSVRTRSSARLGARLRPLIVLFVLAGALFFTFNPLAARGVMERALPGVAVQSQAASQNTEYRVHVLSRAADIGWNHPFGLGFVTDTALGNAGYPAIFIPHTQWGALLVYTGWPGILALAWAGLAVVRRSFQLTTRVPWLHGAVAATGVLIAFQGLAWDVFFSQTWSLGMAALVLALRLGLGAGLSPTSAERRDIRPDRAASA